MAYEEVSRVEITEVIRQWQAGRGIREITRSTGLSRNTSRYPRASPWHFTNQASLDLNPGVLGTQRTSVFSLLLFQLWIQNTLVTKLYSLSNIFF